MIAAQTRVLRGVMNRECAAQVCLDVFFCLLHAGGIIRRRFENPSLPRVGDLLGKNGQELHGRPQVPFRNHGGLKISGFRAWQIGPQPQTAKMAGHSFKIALRWLLREDLPAQQGRHVLIADHHRHRDVN